MRVAIISILITASLSACALPGNTSPISEPWQLSLEVSGGFAGIHRQVTLSNTGELAATDHNTGANAAAQLSAADLGEVASLVSQIQLSDVPANNILQSCNDCFEYTLRMTIGGEQIEFVANDISLEDSPFAPLINKMNDLLQKALAGDFGE
jgi:hypothetical protein